MDNWLTLLIVVAVLAAFYLYQRRRSRCSDSSGDAGYPTAGETNARQGLSKSHRDSERNDSDSGDSGGGGDGGGGGGGD